MEDDAAREQKDPSEMPEIAHDDPTMIDNRLSLLRLDESALAFLT